MLAVNQSRRIVGIMNNNGTFTNQEIKTIEVLIRLGDSKELAEKTVINDRKKTNNRDFYAFAYER